MEELLKELPRGTFRKVATDGLIAPSNHRMIRTSRARSGKVEVLLRFGWATLAIVIGLWIALALNGAKSKCRPGSVESLLTDCDP
jgi:hypothetical protein